MMLRGEFWLFSVERLLRFPVALDQGVEIVIKPHRGWKDPAAIWYDSRDGDRAVPLEAGSRP